MVGEGVEQAGQIAQLMRLGVQAGQGYLLGRPGSLPRSGFAPAVPASAAELELPAEAVSPIAAWRHSIGLPV